MSVAFQSGISSERHTVLSRHLYQHHFPYSPSWYATSAGRRRVHQGGSGAWECCARIAFSCRSSARSYDSAVPAPQQIEEHQEHEDVSQVRTVQPAIRRSRMRIPRSKKPPAFRSRCQFKIRAGIRLHPRGSYRALESKKWPANDQRSPRSATISAALDPGIPCETPTNQSKITIFASSR